MSQSNYSSQQPHNQPTDVNTPISKTSIDYEQAIQLIKSLLGLEYCLQYQIVPLTVEQRCLTLGMVNPEDKNALNFVRPIANALGYSLGVQCIDSDTHQSVLAEYLQQNYSSGQNKGLDRNDNFEQTIADLSNFSTKDIRDSAMTMADIPFEPTKINQEKNHHKDLYNDPTLVVDRFDNSADMSVEKMETPLEDKDRTLHTPIKDDSLKSASIPNQNPESTPYFTVNQVLEAKAEVVPELAELDLEPNLEQEETAAIDSSLDFDISASSETDNLIREALSTLTPQQLWQELFTKLLDGSIDKLSLERNGDRGCILWSQDEMESFQDNVSKSIFNYLVNEVKTLVKVPLQPLTKTKKVAIEKQYNQERLLLPIEIAPGEWGDEIKIQVLRGEALKSYKQRQMKKMTNQALNFAQQLEKTLARMCVCFDSGEISDLSKLQQVQQKINLHLELLER